MAVVSVNELFHGDGSLDASPLEKLQRIFRVVTDSVTDDFSIVKLGTGVPRLYDPHPNNSAAWVESLSGSLVDRDNDPFNWDVEVNYTTQLPPSLPEPDNPLLDTAEIQWGLTSRTVVVDKGKLEAADGTPGTLLEPIRNSAGDRFDPAPEMEIWDRTLTITRNEASFDPATLDTIQGKVNSTVFMGAAAGTIRFLGASATNGFRSGIPFWRVTYQFQQKLPDWVLEVANVGYNELDGVVRKRITDSNGVEVTSPAALDRNGKKIINPTDPTTPIIFLRWAALDSTDLNQLNLP